MVVGTKLGTVSLQGERLSASEFAEVACVLSTSHLSARNQAAPDVPSSPMPVQIPSARRTRLDDVGNRSKLRLEETPMYADGVLVRHSRYLITEDACSLPLTASPFQRSLYFL